MNSSIGHLLILLFSTAALIEEGASETHHDEKVEDGSQKTHEDGELGGIRGYGGRQMMVSPIVYGPPPVLMAAGPQPLQNAQQPQDYKYNRKSHSHARGEIQIDLSNLLEEIGVSQIHETVDLLHKKVDGMYGVLKEVIEQKYNDVNPIKNLNSKADYLTQAVQTLFAGMQSLNIQMKSQQQLLTQHVDNKCDTGGFEKLFQVLHDSLTRVVQEVNDFKAYENEAMKVVLQAVSRNSEALSFLQNGVSATYNSCSACSFAQQEPQVIPVEHNVGEAVNRMVSTVASSLTQNVQRAIHDDMEAHANQLMRYSADGNQEIKKYLLELSQKMMDYRDEYIKRLLDQSRKMEVIKKTVTETTQVMQQAAAGTQQAANQITASASIATKQAAQRSLDSSSMCGGGKNKRGINK